MLVKSRAVQEPGEGVVHQELHEPPDEAILAPYGRALWLCLRICHLQVALLAAQAGLPIPSSFPNQSLLRLCALLNPCICQPDVVRLHTDLCNIGSASLRKAVHRFDQLILLIFSADCILHGQ